MAGKRITAAEKELRISSIQDMLISGYRRSEILQNATIEAWGINARAIDEYIAQANIRIAQEIKEVLPNIAQKIVQRYDLCFKRMMKRGDVRGALAANNSLVAYLSRADAPMPDGVDTDAVGMPILSMQFEVNTRKRNENIQEAEIVNEAEIPVKRINS